MNFNYHIKLITLEDLDKEKMRMWYDTVKSTAPSGITQSYTVMTKKGQKNLVVVLEKKGNEYHYYIPLTRNLLEHEVVAIVKEWDKLYTKGDFSIETSAETVCSISDNKIEIPAERINNFAEKLAKTIHNNWYKEKMDAGWRYGVTFNQRDKVSPMLRTWDNLATEYKKVDKELPQLFLSFLNDEGYVVIAQDDFDGLVKKALSAKI